MGRPEETDFVEQYIICRRLEREAAEAGDVQEACAQHHNAMMWCHYAKASVTTMDRWAEERNAA